MCTGTEEARPSLRDAIGERVRTLAFEAGARPSDHGFGRMFPTLCGATHTVRQGPHLLRDLSRLAASMAEPEAPAISPRARAPGDGDLPAAYTYLVQFVHNDLVWERRGPDEAGLSSAAFAPLDQLGGLLNRRSGRLELDSVYDAPRDPAAVRRMLLGPLAPGRPGDPARPPRKADGNDLPRHPRSRDPARDRTARMEDARNDAHLILGQLHVAFLKAHNALVASGLSFEAARRALRQRYQWMVLHDLMPKLCAPAVADEVLAEGARTWRAERPADLAMPVEFCAAGFALSAVMARPSYDYNPHLRAVERAALSTRAVLGGGGRGADSLPEHLVIGWEAFLPLEATAPQRSRRLNTLIAGAPEAAAAIALRKLAWGVRLGLPTGQAVARHLGLKPLADDTLLAALPEHQRVPALPFCDATPLWFYLLAEAGNPEGPAGAHLGPVGSRIVAEGLWTAVRHSDASILAAGAPLGFERFSLSDLILLAAEEDAA